MILFEESERFRDADNYLRQGKNTFYSYAVDKRDESSGKQQ